MLRVGVIGFGTIARDVAAGIEAGQAGDLALTAILARDRARVQGAPRVAVVTVRVEAFLAEPFDVAVELAGQPSVAQYGEAILAAGRDLMVVSVGALADDALLGRLVEAARRAGRRVLVPSGAIGGLDMLAAGAAGGLDSVTLTTRKPPAALLTPHQSEAERAALLAATEPTTLYEGSAREAVRLFPQNVNVAAAVSLAGIGFDRTQVRVVADPAVTRNTHEVQARGAFGEFRVQVQNAPSPANPKTGVVTAMSVLKALRNLNETVVVGL